MKLDAEKLHIGNKITRKSNPNVICYVTCGIIKEIESGRHDYIPIPISEPHLLEHDWNYYNGQDKGDMTKDFGGKIDIDWVDGKMQIKSHYEGKDMYRPLDHIKYVHQLQNLKILDLEE